MSDKYHDRLDKEHLMTLISDLCVLHSRIAYEHIDDDNDKLDLSTRFARLVSYLTGQVHKISEEKDIDLQ